MEPKKSKKLMIIIAIAVVLIVAIVGVVVFTNGNKKAEEKLNNDKDVIETKQKVWHNVSNSLSADFEGSTLKSNSNFDVNVNIYNTTGGFGIYFKINKITDKNNKATLKMTIDDDGIKTNDVTEEYSLSSSIQNNYSLYATSNKESKFFDYLYNGNDIKCVIEIETPRKEFVESYNFIVESDNIVEVCNEINKNIEEEKETRKNVINSTEKAIEAYLQENDYRTEAIAYFKNNTEEYKILNNEEITSFAENNYLQITFQYEYKTVYKYSKDTQTQIGRYNNGKYEQTNYNHKFKIDNNLLCINELSYSQGSNGTFYQIRKLKDGYYLLYKTDEQGNNAELYCLAVQYTEDNHIAYDYK